MSACPSCGRPKVEAVFCACKPPVMAQTDNPSRQPSGPVDEWYRQYINQPDTRSRETQ